MFNKQQILAQTLAKTVEWTYHTTSNLVPSSNFSNTAYINVIF